VPVAAAGFSALGLLTADHVVDESRSYLAPWKEADLGRLTEVGDRLDADATAELHEAGIADQRIERSWFANLVFPGQTFDVAIPLERSSGGPFLRGALEAAVQEFHRRNAEARLIESRAEEPLVRGLRLVAVGRTDHPDLRVPAAPSVQAGRGSRKVHLGGEWVEADVVDVSELAGSVRVRGPALIELPFSTVVLQPGDLAEASETGDIVVEIGSET
jgi:N-methylhydantoinase A